jgi:hypothetical protein
VEIRAIHFRSASSAAAALTFQSHNRTFAATSISKKRRFGSQLEMSNYKEEEEIHGSHPHDVDHHNHHPGPTMLLLPPKEYVEKLPEWLKRQVYLPFACTECGKCCQRGNGDVYMNRNEFMAVAQYLNMSTDDFIRTYSQHVLYEDDQNKNDARQQQRQVAWIHFSSPQQCVFLDPETKHCRIHPVKPVQCRTYPFYPQLLHSLEAWNAECREPTYDDTATTTAEQNGNDSLLLVKDNSGCEGMRPILLGSNNGDDNSNYTTRASPTEATTNGVSIQSVLQQMYEYEEHERDLFGDLYQSPW